MATSGIHSDGEDINMEWPLAYVRERKEYVCGRCGQVLVSNHTAEDLETHFKSCKKHNENALLMEIRKLNRKLEAFDTDGEAKVNKMKTEEIRNEIANVKNEFRNEFKNQKTEFEKAILDLKSLIKKNSMTEIKNTEASDQVLCTFSNKLIDLEKQMLEMDVTQEMKMAEVSGRVSGVTETISTAVHSILEAKGTSSAVTEETEAIWAQMRKSEREIQSLKTEMAEMKKGAEAFLEHLKTNDRGLRDLKMQLDDETSKPSAIEKIEKTFNEEPSSFDQLTIPMNCFNLVTQSHLFRASFKWSIDGIEAILAQDTFEMTSDSFQLQGYPVRARAKFQLKEDGGVYISLCWKEEDELKSFSPIPQVFYLLKGRSAGQPQHMCQSQAYMSGSVFTSSLQWELCFVYKSWLSFSKFNVNDSVEIEIYVEPFPVTRSVFSYNGILEWNIESYAERLRLERKKSLYFQESPYFYTGPNGFRVQVRIKLNGEGRGPTARIMFITGIYDAALPESFPHSTTVTLVDRKDPGRSIKKTVVKDIQNENEYTFKICQMEEVKNLIENDTLFCKVIIKAQ